MTSDKHIENENLKKKKSTSRNVHQVQIAETKKVIYFS